jgi:hypothetical protein
MSIYICIYVYYILYICISNYIMYIQYKYIHAHHPYLLTNQPSTLRIAHLKRNIFAFCLLQNGYQLQYPEFSESDASQYQKNQVGCTYPIKHIPMNGCLVVSLSPVSVGYISDETFPSSSQECW